MLLPAALGLVGLAGGLAAGHLLRPTEPPGPAAAATRPPDPVAEAAALTDAPPPFDPNARRDYVRLNRQFIVPLVSDRAVDALVIVTLSIEAEAGLAAEVTLREPKLRDALLRAMFRHAQSGGFRGAFTAGPAMRDLRGALLEAARSVLGPGVHEVLVTDILRQDL